jgi:sugar phosphate isomerase/epimerase
MEIPMDRRSFIAAAGALMAAGCAPTTLQKSLPPRPWGLQLFTVLALIENDIEAALRTVAALGYKEVETIGSLGRDPALVRGLLDRNGLTSPSQHIAPDKLYASFSAWTRKQITSEQNRDTYVELLSTGNAIAAIRDGAAKAKVLGQAYVTWPILMPAMLATREILDSYIRIFNEGGRICREEGLTFAFHNHAREFEKLGNDVIYDVILAETDPKLVKMEMDLYWISKAGKDVQAYFKANPGRFSACHVKDMDAAGDFAPAGSGRLDLPGMIAGARANGVQHFFVEIDRSDNPTKAITDSIGYLSTLN